MSAPLTRVAIIGVGRILVTDAHNLLTGGRPRAASAAPSPRPSSRPASTP
jgi:hypothetical protein